MRSRRMSGQVHRYIGQVIESWQNQRLPFRVPSEIIARLDAPATWIVIDAYHEGLDPCDAARLLFQVETNLIQK